MKIPLLFAYVTLCLLGPGNYAFTQTTGPHDGALSGHPFVFGFMGGGGSAVADHITNIVGRAPATLNFLNAGVRFGKVLSSPHGSGAFRNQFEVATEFSPFWQAVYPTQQLVFHVPGGTQTDPAFGYTTRGVSLTPVQLRLVFVRRSSIVPWVQIACGVLWTTLDFPTIKTASVNFMPQTGVGAHLFIRKHQSLDFAVNAVHISNGDTADKNPGVNVTVQASIGYSWWFHNAK